MTIKTTSEHCRDCGAAVCVKDYGRGYADGGTEEQRTRAYESAQGDWWRNANDIARKHGFSGATACGRSGGWCAPYTEDADDDTRSNGGRRVEFSEDDTAPAFVAFAADIEALLKSAPQMFADELARVIAEDAESEARDERERTHAEALSAIVPRLADALRALPDDVDMIEHNPDDGARYFCCGRDVEFNVHPSRWPAGSEHTSGRVHDAECWYTAARATLAEYDELTNGDKA